MKKNRHTLIIGQQVALVSYKKEHVSKYHEWMSSEELQNLTGSEPLNLKDEYKMQQSWLQDPNKCTFIILEKEPFWETKNETSAMIGDTNLFLNMAESPLAAEVEIMIAEKGARGKGMGWEATLLMLCYGMNDLNVSYFFAKIGIENAASVALFKKLGFELESESKVFFQFTYFKSVTPAWKIWIEEQINFIKINNYIFNN